MSELDDRLVKLEKQMSMLVSSAQFLQRAERLRMLGDEPIRTIWFDNVECKIFVPDALDDRIQTIILNTGRFFEDSLLRQVQKFIKPNSVVADVGANIGNHSVFFSKICGARKVYAFEPQARAAKIIVRNRAINAIEEDELVVMNCGCGSRNSKLKIVHQNDANIGATQFAYDDNGGFEVKRLDDCGIAHLDFLKIDTERFADSVLAGGERLINACKPVIWVELYGDEETRSLPILGSYGYAEAHRLSPADRIFLPR